MCSTSYETIQRSKDNAVCVFTSPGELFDYYFQCSLYFKEIGYNYYTASVHNLNLLIFPVYTIKMDIYYRL